MEHTGSFFGDGSLGFYDDGRTSGPLEDWMREVLIQALIDQGCPGDSAPALAEHANLRTGEGLAWELDVHSALYLADSTQVSREEFSEAARGIAEDLRQQSADIRDARRRGEQWLDPYWDVPDQGPRM